MLQAFGSVEEVDQIESVMKPEEGKEVSKIPLKDCPDVANPNVTSESGDPPKKISVGSGLPEQPQSTNNNNPATKRPATDLTVKTVATQPSPEPSEPQGAASRPVAEAQAGSKLTENLPVSRSTEEPKVTITADDKAGEEHPKAPTQESKAPESKEVECSESVEIIQIPERVKERGSNKEDVKSLVNTETENKVAGNRLSEVSTTKDPKLPVRAAYATENTDILKLETEVSNVYIPAPPLGEATVNKTQESKAPVSEPSCATEPSLTEGNKASTIAVEAGIAEKEDPNFSDIEEITESELQTIKTPQTSDACVCEKDMDSTKEKVADVFVTKPLDSVEANFPENYNNKAAEMTVAIDSEKHAPALPEARASVTVTSHSRRSPDTLDSDDSPSALEMEDIPTAWARPLSGLMAPPAAPFLALGRVVSGEPVLRASSNTSLDGTEPTLSEEEPEMESLYPQSDFLVVTDELKPEVSPVVVSPAGTTYSVSTPNELPVCTVMHVADFRG